MNKKIYYHLLSSQHAMEDLREKRIKVSTLDTLNDPFEMVPYLRYRSLERRAPYHKLRREISKKYGLLCFSQGWGEPLLWSHYADRHRGIAIGFEILQDEVVEVSYSSDPIRRQIELTNNLEANERLFLDLAKVKYKGWEYEDEVRILVELADCIRSGGHLFIPFGDRLKVGEIVLGCKFDHRGEKENIKDLAGQLGAIVIPSRQGWEDYKIRQCGTKTRLYGDTRPAQKASKAK